MPSIQIKDGEYLLRIDKEQKAIPKQCRMRWSPGLNGWITKDWARALRACEVLGITTKLFDQYLLKRPKRVLNLCAPEHLYPYQKEGVKAICANESLMLADEQGLGKTLQIIEAMRILKPEKAIVVCPASLKYTWLAEFEKWYPELSVEVIKTGRHKISDSTKVAIVNYDLIGRRNIYDELKAFNAEMAVYDEAHYLKNVEAKRTKAAFLIGKNVRRRVLLSGTPMINRPIELYALLRFLKKEILKPYDTYKLYGYKFCDGKQDQFSFDVSGASNTDELNYRLRRGIMLRRLKKDVLKELPDKTVQLIPMDPTCDTTPVLNKEKNLDVKEILKRPEAQLVGEMATIRRELGLAKLPQAVSYIRDLLNNIDKVVVFAYHREVCESLQDKLSDLGAVLVYGGTTTEKRRDNINEFQKDADIKVFIGQIQAAGAGVTLTASSHVVFVENSWVPGEVDQAIDRCHRIGQKNPVNAQFLVVKDSIDHIIMRSMLNKKRITKEILK